MERELIQRCCEQDREAQQELYIQTSQRVYGLILRMTGNVDDAMELTQDVYLKAFAGIDEFAGRSTIATWLYRIAVNEAIQFLKKARRRLEKQREAGLIDPPESPDGATGTRLDIGDALAQLSPSDNAILLLRYQEGLDYRAVAETIGCAEGTVASRLSRARNRLHGLLMKDYGGGESTRCVKVQDM